MPLLDTTEGRRRLYQLGGRELVEKLKEQQAKPEVPFSLFKEEQTDWRGQCRYCQQVRQGTLAQLREPCERCGKQ